MKRPLMGAHASVAAAMCHKHRDGIKQADISTGTNGTVAARPDEDGKGQVIDDVDAGVEAVLFPEQQHGIE